MHLVFVSGCNHATELAKELSMKYKNIFKPVKKEKRIEYTDVVIAAVLDPSIKGLCLNFNGGYDWIDTKYKFILLLLQRGQISQITSGSDLLARQDYLDASTLHGFVGVGLEVRIHGAKRLAKGLVNKSSLVQKKNECYASEKRILIARERIYQHCMKFKLVEAV
jgi:hypothetical protein